MAAEDYRGTPVTWLQLVKRATDVCRARDVSPTMYAGSVATALLSAENHVYTGISVDTACSLGFCAERNAVGSLLTAGETRVTRLVAVRDRDFVLPCGACRELLRQLGPTSTAIEILVSLTPLTTITLGDLLPHYWNK